jgi:hypothetical protein
LGPLYCHFSKHVYQFCPGGGGGGGEDAVVKHHNVLVLERFTRAIFRKDPVLPSIYIFFLMLQIHIRLDNGVWFLMDALAVYNDENIWSGHALPIFFFVPI